VNTIVKIMLLTFILSSCAATGGSFCKIAQPNRFSPSVVDAMTDAEVNAALAHNLKGKTLCGWKE
jgi:hypothetical protein